MSKPLPWFRAYTEMMDDEKLRLLAFEDRWHFVAILCMKGAGILDESGPLLMRKAAVKMGLAVRELDEVARRLSEVGLIDKDTLQPLAWDARQMKSDSSADRVQAYRERQRQAKRDGNVTVTAQDTDTDKEEEEKTKKTAPRKRVAPPAAIAKPDDVDQQTWGDWVALRTKKRATVSITVVEEARRECAKAGLTLERFLQVWCMRGSQGLEAAWLKPDERGHATGETAYQRSMRERIEEAAPSIARRAPAQQQDATDYFRTVDVPARDVTRHAIEVQP